MNELFPLAPQMGLSTAWYLVIVLGIGLLFGFALERAGFGSAKNLTAIFVLRDFRVFRVMFTAVLTAMFGAHLLHFLGLFNLTLIPIEANYFWAISLGGLVFGMGFYLGGFCPGTAVVAIARGRWDGLAFLFGITLGIYGFALLFDGVGSQQWFQNFYAPSEAAATTLYQGGPAWPWILGITAAAMMGFWITPKVEKRFALASVAEHQAAKEQKSETRAQSAPTKHSFWRILGPVGASILLLAIIISEWSRPDLALAIEQPRLAPVLASEEEDTNLSAQTLAGWIIEEAHRVGAGSELSLWILDLRPESEHQAIPIPSARHLQTNGLSAIALTELVIEELARLDIQPSTPLVIIATDEDSIRPLLVHLRRRHHNAFLMSGGGLAWQREVLEWDLAATSLSPAGREAMQAVWSDVQAWLAGERQELPPRFVFPGAIMPEIEVATTIATGSGAGGGCN